MKPSLIDDKEYEILHDFCRRYIDEYCIWRPKNEEEKKKAGQHGQFLLRRGIFNSQFATAISLLFLKKIHDEIGHFNFQIAGLETGATPLVQAINLVALQRGINLNSFIIRKDVKASGVKNTVEGIPHPRLPVLICDDTTISGKTISKAQSFVKKKGYAAHDIVFTIVGGDKAPLLDENTKHIMLYNFDEFDFKWRDSLPYWDIV